MADTRTDRPVAGLDAAPPAAPSRGPTERLRGTGVTALIVAVPFVLWHAGSVIADTQLLPTPAAVVQALYEEAASGLLWHHAQVTLWRAGAGLAIAFFGGVAFAVLLARVRIVRATFEPLFIASYPIPKLTFYPILIVIFGFGAAPKIGIVALTCAYPIAYNTLSAIEGIDRRYFWVARNIGAPRRELLSVMLRASSPMIMAALRLATPIALIMIVATELMGESRGLGYVIHEAGGRFRPERALAMILALGIVGSTLDRLIVWGSRKLTFWAKSVRL